MEETHTLRWDGKSAQEYENKSDRGAPSGKRVRNGKKTKEMKADGRDRKGCRWETRGAKRVDRRGFSVTNTKLYSMNRLECQVHLCGTRTGRRPFQTVAVVKWRRPRALFQRKVWHARH